MSYKAVVVKNCAGSETLFASQQFSLLLTISGVLAEDMRLLDQRQRTLSLKHSKFTLALLAPEAPRAAQWMLCCTGGGFASQVRSLSVGHPTLLQWAGGRRHARALPWRETLSSKTVH